MAQSVCEQGLAAALVLLKAITSVPGLDAAQVERNRQTPVVNRPAIVMYDGGRRVIDLYAGIEHIEQRFDLELHAADEAPEAAIDELYVASKLALIADHTLGGLVFDLREDDSDDPQFAVTSAGPLGGQLRRFVMELMVKELDPTAVAP